jgi:hypothetical protein
MSALDARTAMQVVVCAWPKTAGAALHAEPLEDGFAVSEEDREWSVNVGETLGSATIIEARARGNPPPPPRGCALLPDGQMLSLSGDEGLQALVESVQADAEPTVLARLLARYAGPGAGVHSVAETGDELIQTLPADLAAVPRLPALTATSGRGDDVTLTFWSYTILWPPRSGSPVAELYPWWVRYGPERRLSWRVGAPEPVQVHQ